MVLTGLASIIGGVVRIGQHFADEFLRTRERRAQIALRRLEHQHELALLRFESAHAQTLNAARVKTDIITGQLRTDSQLAKALSRTMGQAYAHDNQLVSDAPPVIKSLAASIRPVVLLVLLTATIALALQERSGSLTASIAAMTESAVAYYFVDRSLFKRQTPHGV